MFSKCLKNIKRFSNFFLNLKYLSRYDLRENGLVGWKYEELLENIMYYTDTTSLPRPKIYNAVETLDLICNTKSSLVRFGDGEAAIMKGDDIFFQKYEKVLAERMKSIILNQNKNILVGVNRSFFYPSMDFLEKDLVIKHFGLYTVPTYRKVFVRFLDLNKEYVDAGVTFFRGCKQTPLDVFYKKVRSVWAKKEVILVGCREAFNNIQYDLFDNAEKENRIYIPNKNAFSVYNEILDDIKSYDKNILIILMAGPTAKLLVEDLSNLGYRTLDLGHIAKAYDWYNKKQKLNHNFFLPDE